MLTLFALLISASHDNKVMHNRIAGLMALSIHELHLAERAVLQKWFKSMDTSIAPQLSKFVQ